VPTPTIKVEIGFDLSAAGGPFFTFGSTTVEVDNPQSQFAPNGEDRLFVLMERKPQATPAPRYTSAYATAGALSSNGRIEQAIMQGSGRLEQIMIRDMNAEIADSARALRNAFHSLQEIGN